VQEYLANVANRTVPPSTFDMRKMLSQLPGPTNQQEQRQNGKAAMLNNAWTEAQERRLIWLTLKLNAHKYWQNGRLSLLTFSLTLNTV
jgi:hypothetical protein